MLSLRFIHVRQKRRPNRLRFGDLYCTEQTTLVPQVCPDFFNSTGRLNEVELRSRLLTAIGYHICLLPALWPAVI